MSIFDKYLSVADILYICAVFPFVGVVLAMMTGQIPATVEAMSIAFGAAGTVAGGLVFLGQKLQQVPVCNKLECTLRTPTLKEQGL